MVDLGWPSPLRGFVVPRALKNLGDYECIAVGGEMRVSAENLDRVLFSMFLQSGADPTSAEFKDLAATIELVGEDEREIVEALGRLHDKVADWRRKRN